MKEIVFATNNQHKVNEIVKILGRTLTVLKLSDIGFHEDIPETGTTLEDNASIKSRAIFDRFGVDCFSDDTGLEVDALDGAPGVYSARYAGEGCSYNDNVVKLLKELGNSTNRQARFRTVISLILNKKEYFFEGTVEGEIIHLGRGEGGFGYDPVFQPLGYDKTFAEMGDAEKNAISHRGKAVAALAQFLLKQDLK